MGPDDRASHPATDHGLHPLFSAMTGSDVVLSGTKASGEPFEGRRLLNVSFVPRRSGVYVIGLDPELGEVRQFRVSLLSRIESGSVATLDRESIVGLSL